MSPRVRVSGGMAYVAQGNGTRILDISDPAQLKPVGFLPAVETETARTDVDVRGSRLLTVESQYQGPISVWTNSPVTAPALIQTLSFRTVPFVDRGPPSPMALGRDLHPCRAQPRDGVQSRPGARLGRRFIGPLEVSVTSRTLPLTRRGTSTFVGTGGLQVIPNGGGFFGELLALPAAARGVTAMGAHAFVACGTAGLLIVEAANPTALRVAGTAVTLAPARGVTVRLPYAFVATGEGGVEVFDVTDVAKPVRVSAFDTPGEAQSVELDGDLLYVADGAAGVAVLEFGLGRKSQEITLPPLFDRDYQGAAFRIPVVSSSGLPVLLKVVSGPATFTGDLCWSNGTGWSGLPSGRTTWQRANMLRPWPRGALIFRS